MKHVNWVVVALSLFSSLSSYAETRAFEADFVCKIVSDGGVDLYTIAALNPEFARVASALIVVKHNPKTGSDSVIAFTKKISVEKFVSPSGLRGVRFAGVSNKQPLALNVFMTKFGPKAHSEFNGGSGPNMDCQSNTTLIVNDER